VSELSDLQRAVQRRADLVARADRDVDEAILRAYRAERGDGTPMFTLAEIGGALGVSRQRAYQLVREVAARLEPGTRTGTGA
jgi:DNA-directed RNA polymerase sigma subunit (sigma70/sigma32)